MVLLILVFLVYVILLYVINRIVDKRKIFEGIKIQGGKILSFSRYSVEKGWYKNRYPRAYSVIYLDQFENKHKAIVCYDPFKKPERGFGDYSFEEDTILEVSQTARLSEDSLKQKYLILEQENLRLKKEIESLKAK